MVATSSPVLIGQLTDSHVVADADEAVATGAAVQAAAVLEQVEHSVILERARISGVPRLTDSLIGRDTEVRRSQQRPSATRLMIGDHCSIDLE